VKSLILFALERPNRTEKTADDAACLDAASRRFLLPAALSTSEGEKFLSRLIGRTLMSPSADVVLPHRRRLSKSCSHLPTINPGSPKEMHPAPIDAAEPVHHLARVIGRSPPRATCRMPSSSSS